VEVRFLNQDLHRTPDRLPKKIQEEVDRAGADGPVVLGYGLCSGGVAGVRAPACGLAVPRVHDCIALFLGSRGAYDREFSGHPGTYYLTPGWVEVGQDPLSYMERDYVPRMGREAAEEGLREELLHYTRIALVQTGTGDEEALRRRALENARFLGKEYVEIRGTGRYFDKILAGPYDPEDFLLVPPGETVRQTPFLKGGPAAGTS